MRGGYLLFAFILIHPLFSVERKQGHHVISTKNPKNYFETITYSDKIDEYVTFNKKDLVSKHIVDKQSCISKYLCNFSSFFAEDNITIQVAATRNKKIRIRQLQDGTLFDETYLSVSSGVPHITYYSVERYIKENYLQIAKKQNNKVKLLIPATKSWLDITIIEDSSNKKYKTYKIRTNNILFRPVLGNINVKFDLEKKVIIKYSGIHFARLIPGIFEINSLKTKVYYNIL